MSIHDARALLALPKDYVAPSAEELLADAQRIVAKNLELGEETARLADQGLLVSPIWELGPGDGEAQVMVRLAVLPASFRGRYFEAEGREVLGEPAALELVCDVLSWLLEDPIGAVFALEDTLRVWLDDTAPTRTLDVPYRGHYKLLSLLLADIARKGAAGLDTLEWIGSIGLPIEESREPDDPPVERIVADMKLHLDEMWEEERRWLSRAFGR
ncbi:MAG: hypothetical protein U0271_14685 [Polyangiaceae bacterium]